MRSLFFLPLVALGIGLAACGGSDETQSSSALADTTSRKTSESEQHDFRLFLSGAVQDTLQGNAHFGTVMNTNTGKRRFVIEMVVEGNPASGVYVTHDDTTRPASGAYDMVSAADSAATGGQQLAVVWRSGIRRHLTSSRGTITLKTATDTLIAGRMEGTLRGNIAENATPAGTDTGPKEVQIDGQFRAENGSVSYIGY